MNEPVESFGSTDKHHRFLSETRLDSSEYQPSSSHGLVVEADDKIVASHLFATSGGATGVHDHSAVIAGDSCLVAVGPYVASLSLPMLDISWALEADPATVFGVHLSRDRSFLLTHGELLISRISFDGKVSWQAGGADIFTEGFSVHDKQVRAVDFENREYVFDIETGDASAA